MQSTSKVRAEPRVQVRPPDALFAKILRYCEVTGSTLSNFGLIALENAVEEIGDPDNPTLLRRRKPAKSA